MSEKNSSEISHDTVERAAKIIKTMRLSRNELMDAVSVALNSQTLTPIEQKEAGVWAKAFELAANPMTSITNAALALHDLISK